MSDSCGTCRYFLLQDEASGSGACRRNPPLPIASQWVSEPSGNRATNLSVAGGQPKMAIINTVMQVAASFPGMSATDGWCGCWTANLH